MSTKVKVAVLGNGGWGTAMAMVLESSGHSVAVWGYDADYLDEMRRTRENRLFLPGIAIPDGIEFEDDILRAVKWADIVVTAIPSKFLRSVLSTATGALATDKPVLSLTKGIDSGTLERPSEVIRECLGSTRVAALSGPSHADEVARRLPASVVVASDELETARYLQRVVSTPRFRVYASRDIVGVEVAGAMKNIIALAGGILHGMGMGDNALSALITRGVVEMTRLGVALGGEAATFSGLAGVGDLITTCISPLGRNRRVGMLLAQGKSLDDILSQINGVPESVSTTTLALDLARRHYIDMPITEQVAKVLWEGRKPEMALDDLMNRARKDED